MQNDVDKLDTFIHCLGYQNAIFLVFGPMTDASGDCIAHSRSESGHEDLVRCHLHDVAA